MVDDTVKRATGFRVSDKQMAEVQRLMEKDGSRSFQKFCERALDFYIAYLSGKDSENYVVRTMDNALRGMFSQFQTEERRSSYKISIAMTELMLAFLLSQDFSAAELRSIRAKAVEIVERTGGPESLQATQQATQEMWDGEGDCQDS